MHRWRLFGGLVAAICSLFLLAGSVLAADLATLVTDLVTGGYSDRDAAITALAASGEARAAPILQALSDGELYVRSADKRVVIGKGNKKLALTDAITGKDAGTAAEDDLERVKINNRLRGTIESAMGSLTLMNPDPRVRRDAADAVFKRRDPSALPALETALAAEKNPAIKRTMTEARASVILASPDAPKAQKLEAIPVVQSRGDADAMSVLQATANGGDDAELKVAAMAAAAAVRQSLAAWEAAQNVWYGISLGSVLLLAAIGLAITFGTMGVINMAHGEMVMLGAYTTFVVQQLLQAFAPNLFYLSLIIALPLAFLVSGAVGVLIERTIIRFLY